MSSTASQLQFSAELVTLLTAASGLVLVGLRADLTGEARWARAALGSGFVAIGAAAFVHGSLLSPGDPYGSLTLVRLAGDGAVAAGALRWPDRRVRLGLWVGLVLSAIGALTEPAASLATVTDAFLIAGSAVIAAALVVAGRSSIVARVAASAAATLLLVVLVLSVALSAVIASSAQRDQLSALGARAAVEGSALLTTAADAIKDARFFAADLAGTVPASTLGSLAAGASGPGAIGASAVSSRLAFLAGLYPVGALGYVLPNGQVVTASGPAAANPVVLAARQPLVTQMTCQATAGRSSVLVEAGTAVAVAAYPECQLVAGTLLGTVVVADPLGAGYLASRHRVDPATSLALATPSAVLASAGPQPAAGLIEALAARAESTDTASTRTANGRYLAVEPLRAAADFTAAPIASLVVSTSDASVIQQRNRLERALFLIALGGTLLALLFVAAVGDRITVGLRRLTQVAERVRRGSTGERAGMASADEVGTLGAAFDSMMASVEAQTAALQAAAEDETRLRNRLEAVVAGMGDALVATDASGAVSDFNAAAEALTETPAASAVGRPATEVLDLRGDDGWPLTAGLLAPGPQPVAVAGNVVAAGGRQVPVAVSVGSLEGANGEAAGVVLVLRDLRREQELERMKSEFLSRIGHELRTPLTGIIGYANILLRRRVPQARAQQWYGQILESAKRLQRIVELMEFVAASEAGRVMVNAQPIDVKELARDITEAWTDRLPNGVQLQRRVARATPAVQADRRWLTLAVNELIDNAVKFSPGGGRVGISAQPAPSNGAVDITVTDRGLGMDQDEQVAAFAEFTQGDSSDTRRFGGLGLGLALVQRVAFAHGGTVLCHSVPGTGSRFTIRLPAVPAEHPTPTKAAAVR